MIRIAVTGPESSGKSDLTKALSDYYGANYVREYAREYLQIKGGKYDFEDLDAICRGQIEEEERVLAMADGLCFFDTEMIVFKIWSLFRYGRISPFIETSLKNREYDHYLLCAPDLPWAPDPFRESPSKEEREYLFMLYLEELQLAGASFAIIKGEGPSRLESAILAIRDWGYTF